MIRRPVHPRPSHRRGRHGRPARGKAPTALHTMIPRRVRRVGSSSVRVGRERERGGRSRSRGQGPPHPTPERRRRPPVPGFCATTAVAFPPSSPMRSLRLSGSPPSARTERTSAARSVRGVGWEGLRPFLRPSVCLSFALFDPPCIHFHSASIPVTDRLCSFLYRHPRRRVK